MSPSTLRAANRRASEWLRNHVVIWWLVLVVVPGGTFALAELLLNSGHVSRALVLGGAFGTTFATITVVIQRQRRD